MVARIGSKRPFRVFLREWRDYRGLTQEQVADRIGTTKSSVSRWESSNRVPTLTVMAAYAEALDIELFQIFHDPARPSIDDLLNGASDQQRKTATELVKTLLLSQKKDGTNG
jgi:transcriptional regulator with XRE-family HTH domain